MLLSNLSLLSLDKLLNKFLKKKSTTHLSVTYCNPLSSHDCCHCSLLEIFYRELHPVIDCTKYFFPALIILFNSVSKDLFFFSPLNWNLRLFDFNGLTIIFKAKKKRLCCFKDVFYFNICLDNMLQNVVLIFT